jgi:hypothetical protein
MRSQIVAAARAHGLEAEIIDSHVAIDGGLRLHPFLEGHPTVRGQVVLQLNVGIEATALGDVDLVESFGASGATELDAAREAFSRFLLGSFHVIVEALGSHRCGSDQVEWLRWSGAVGTWDVCSGNALIQAGGDESRAAIASLRSVHRGALSSISELFVSTAPTGAHGVRVFIAFFNGELSECEVLLDRRAWAEAQEIVRRAPWKVPPGYVSLRQFLVALPAPKEPGERSGVAAPPKRSWLANALHTMLHGRDGSARRGRSRDRDG